MALANKDLAFRLMLPRDLVLAIGHVVTQWAHFEDQIDLEIVELGKLSVCAGFNARRLIRDTVEARLAGWRDMALVAYSDPEARSDVNEIYQSARDTKPGRDAAAHAMWGKGRRGLVIEFRSKRGKPASIQERADAISDLEACARQISALNALHLRLQSRVEDVLAASPENRC